MSHSQTKEIDFSNIASLSLIEARNARCSTVRPEHVLLALMSTESFLASHVRDAGYEKEALADVLRDIDATTVNRESMIDKLMTVFHNCLQVRIPPYSTDFYHVLKWARKRSRSTNREFISYADLCYALLLDEPDNSRVHECLKRLGLDLRTLKLALESSDLV